MSEFKLWMSEVSEFLAGLYGITINDCTDKSRMMVSYRANESAIDFVEGIATKHNLTCIDTSGGGW